MVLCTECHQNTESYGTEVSKKVSLAQRFNNYWGYICSTHICWARTC